MDESKSERRGSIEIIAETMNEQDFKQKTGMYTSFIMEFYRVIMGSFLIVFIPQKCGNDICSMSDNVMSSDPYKNVVFAFNTITCVLFLHMYYAEMKRENKLINYLDVNAELPRDNDAVGEALVKLPVQKKDAILGLDKYYQRSGRIAMLGFSLNVILSSVVVLTQYLDDKTATVLLTNVLFMATKLYDIKIITDTEENVFLSAYLTRKIQYNDVDPDKIMIENGDVETGIEIQEDKVNVIEQEDSAVVMAT
jgi:hypothetical protein